MFKRHLKPKILQAIEFMPVILLRGARQTGKTTLVKSIEKSEIKLNYNYLTFDHLPTLMAAKDDPVSFISRIKKPVILDEIQRVPELFLPIKSDVDENRIPGRYFLTGSADPLLIPKLGDSLAGRMRLLTLWPLSQGEIEDKEETFLDKAFNQIPFSTSKKLSSSKQNLLSRIIKGGYPAPLLMKNETQRHDWFNDYVSLVLQKDILDLSKIENITQIPNIMMLLASRVGALLNTEEISRSIKLSSMTLQRYLDLLKTLFLIYLLPPWNKNLGKRLVKSPKVYLNDTALQLYLLNIDLDRLIKDQNLIGKVVENFVVLELLKQISWSDINIEIFHYRDYSNYEVDIILEGPGGDLVAIEIKSSQTISGDDFKGLKKFQEISGTKFIQGILLYTGETILPFGDKLTAVPISALWQ
ncbi:MAG: ATP-binding protein [bacterium]